MSIKISIVEDDNGIRESLRELIDSEEDLLCVSVYKKAEEALQDIQRAKPDVILMDINLPGMSGIECTQKVKELLPESQVLMLTMYEDKDQIFRCLTAGASGYLLKRTSPGRILESIREVRTGASPMSGSVARVVVQYFQERKQVVEDTQKLSKREEEILQLLAKGFRYKEIADHLGISFDTVRSHLRNIYDKLHVSSRTEAVVKYLNR